MTISQLRLSSELCLDRDYCAYIIVRSVIIAVIAVSVLGACPQANAGNKARIARSEKPNDQARYDLSVPRIPANPRGLTVDYKKIWRGLAVGQGRPGNKLIPYILEVDLRMVEGDTIEGPFSETKVPLRVVGLEAYRKSGAAALDSGYSGQINVRIVPDLGLVSLGSTLLIKTSGGRSIAGVPLKFESCHALILGGPDRIGSLRVGGKLIYGQLFLAPADESEITIGIYDGWRIYDDRDARALKISDIIVIHDNNARPTTWAALNQYRDWMKWTQVHLRPSERWNHIGDQGEFIDLPRSIEVVKKMITDLHNTLLYQGDYKLSEYSSWWNSVIGGYYGDHDVLTKMRDEHSESLFESTLESLIENAYADRSARLLHRPFDRVYNKIIVIDKVPESYRRDKEQMARDSARVEKAVSELFKYDIELLDQKLSDLTDNLHGAYDSKAVLFVAEDRLRGVMDRPEVRDWIARCVERRKEVYRAALPEFIDMINSLPIQYVEDEIERFITTSKLFGEMGSEDARRAVERAIARRHQDN